MTLPRVTVVLSTSSSESCFIEAIVRECLEFAYQVVISVGTARYDGTPENPEFMKKVATIQDNDDRVKVVGYEVTKEIAFNPLQRRPDAFWHNVSRIVGLGNIAAGAEWILFLDGDEIPEGKVFKTWLENTELDFTCSYKMANYWYFRDARYQAMQWEDSVVLVSNSIFNKETTVPVLMQDDERGDIARVLPKKQRMVVSLDGKPMFHHFSWVRTKKDILDKVRNWGHKGDKPWEQLIEETWNMPFVCGRDKDFVHGYDFIETENVFSVYPVVGQVDVTDVATNGDSIVAQ